MEPSHLISTRTDEEGNKWEVAWCRRIVPLRAEHTKGSGLGNCYGEYQHLHKPPLIAPDGSKHYQHGCTYCGYGIEVCEGEITLPKRFPYKRKEEPF